MIPSAYVHVPFCSTLCPYCAFARTLNQKLTGPWLSQIEKEIRRTIQDHLQDNPDFFYQTVYFGGGTPGLLSEENFERLAALFQDVVRPETEWTIELNPDSVTDQKLAAYKKAGVSRISLGIESLDDERLQKLNRPHTALQAIQAFEQIRRAGFDNISIDLMYGFEDQCLQEVRQMTEAFLRLRPEHISIYSLILEENSVYGKTGVQAMDVDLNADCYEWIARTLCEAGYIHYEVSSFCLPDHMSRHNSLCWQDEDYDGFGYGAIARKNHLTYRHAASLHQYLLDDSLVMEEGQDPAFAAIMTALRTRAGLNIRKWNQTYQRDFEKEFEHVLRHHACCFERRAGFLSLNEPGLEILDEILIEFLPDD